jgi:hypothetical protein
MLLLQARSVEWAATIQMLNRRTVAVNAFMCYLINEIETCAS